MADFNDKNLMTADLALTNFGTGKRASNFTKSKSKPPKKNKGDDSRRAESLSSANGIPSSAQIALQVLSLF